MFCSAVIGFRIIGEDVGLLLALPPPPDITMILTVVPGLLSTTTFIWMLLQFSLFTVELFLKNFREVREVAF